MTNDASAASYSYRRAFTGSASAARIAWKLTVRMATNSATSPAIRKVLGASVAGIVLLLSKDFARLVGIALVLAAPLAYLAMTRWLETFAYRVELSLLSVLEFVSMFSTGFPIPDLHSVITEIPHEVAFYSAPGIVFYPSSFIPFRCKCPVVFN